MKVIQDGREFTFRYTSGDLHQRTTLTLPEPYEGGRISVKATDFIVDIDPVGITLEIGYEVLLESNPRWQAKDGELNTEQRISDFDPHTPG